MKTTDKRILQENSVVRKYIMSLYNIIYVTYYKYIRYMSRSLM